MNRMIPVSVDYAKAGVPAPADPATLNLMILPHQEDITLHPERPMVIVVPGGAYAFCSNREAEAIALNFCKVISCGLIRLKARTRISFML